MSSSWYYDDPTTFTGALQHGLGRGAAWASEQPGAAEAVFACIRRDHRWWWTLDERAVYLARLVRDLEIPVGKLLDLLREDLDDDNAFDNTLGVLDVLARAGDAAAIDGLRGQVRDGPGWVRVVETMAYAWPEDLWQDLLPAAAARIGTVDPAEEWWWRRTPWVDWAARDARIAAAVDACPHPARRQRPLRDDSVDELLAKLRTKETRDTQPDTQRAALRELRCRDPQPALLDIADTLPAEELSGPLGSVLFELGALAVPLARDWAERPPHQMTWTAYQILAEHGDESDVPVLLAGWAWLDRREDDYCGYDRLAGGLARIGGDGARAVVPKLRRAWRTPHTMERAAYLRAVTALDPDVAGPLLVEGLRDCEEQVRRFAVECVPLGGLSRRWIAALRDDPLETPDVRAAATARLAAADAPK